MRQAPNPFKLSGCALAASILVCACGGGASPPNAVPGSSGFAIDDYLSVPRCCATAMETARLKSAK